MKSSAPTIPVEELFALSPALSRKVRDALTPKRVSPPVAAAAIGIQEVTTVDDFDPYDLAQMYQFTAEQPRACIEEVEDEDEIPRYPANAYFNDGVYTIPGIMPQVLRQARDHPHNHHHHHHHGDEIEEVIIDDGSIWRTARDIEKLRSLVAVVNHVAEVECIIDPGCQIIAMSEVIANALGISYDPTRILSMQSANRSTNRTQGLARNVPFAVGNLTLYVQVHVIRDAAYDVLLGRPFDVFTKSIITTISEDQVTITIHCPNTHRSAVIPTFERGRCLFTGKRIAARRDEEDGQDFHTPSRNRH